MKRKSASLLSGLAVATLAYTSLGRLSAPISASADTGDPEGGRRAPPEETGVGHHAVKPSDIPPRGWWSIAKRVAGSVSDHRLMAEAAGITFYTLLALFPALAALVSIYGLFADPATISDQLGSLSQMVPGGGVQIISDQVHSLTSNGNKTLGFALVVGLATSLWSANQAIKAVFDALNVVYDEREQRGFFYRTALTLAFTLGGILFVVLAMAAVLGLPVALNYVGLGGESQLLLRLLRWPVLLIAITLMLALTYRFGPSRVRARWRWVTWGGAFAAIGWLLVSVGFSWYVENFGNYNKTYGSLGAVIGFMTWIWISATVVLIGAELNAEMEHQTERDTTVGPEKPTGARRATKADTVASA
ncbi:MAG: YihY/virulence factor BrkB family protein [Acetobacteraceae bacterium]|nr:YihY/virulence factor BrkB family protein [Acetobacteraceae bacterium]